MAWLTYVDLKAKTWLFRVGLRKCSTDYCQFVYKVESCIRNSIEFSCITQYKSVSFA